MNAVTFSSLATFHDKQLAATAAADAHKYVLYGGARGPGKSHWLRWFCVRFLLLAAARGFKGVRVMLACETYSALKDRHITKMAAAFPQWLGELKDSKAEGLAYHLRQAYGGGVIALRNLDDPEKYKSSEYAAIAIDELTQNPKSVFDKLRGSLRWPGMKGNDTKLIAASNPDGPGQRWVREYWIERQFPAELQGDADKFVFISGVAGDNPYLDASYTDTLRTLPDNLRRAWLDGDWYVTMEGLVYGEVFGADNIQVVEPDAGRPIELAFDDGYIDPRAILFVQRTPEKVLVFDELYHSKHLAETCVGEVVEKCKANGWPKPEIAVGSPEAKEMQTRLRMADIPYRSMPHKIIQGISKLRGLFKDSNGYRTIVVHPRCKNLIRELTEGYVYPEGGTRTSDEVPVDKENHAVDALRYWAWLRV